MSLKRVFYTVMIAISILVLAGCSTPAAQATETATEAPVIRVTDGAGAVIELEQPAVKIISLSPSITEILFAIDAGDQMVGREDMVTYPEEALSVASVGSLFGDLPTETILSMEPDLVLAGEIVTAEQVDALKALGLTVFWQANPTNFEGLYQNIKDLGVLTGNTEKAETLVSNLQGRVNTVTEKLADVQEKPAVFYQLDSTDPANPWTSGGGTFIDYIISMAGGASIATDLDAYAQISTEDLITRNPDVILMGDAMYGITVESVAARPGWDVIKAVQENAIYPIDPYILSVPGPRLVDGLEETARLLHPDVFAE